MSSSYTSFPLDLNRDRTRIDVLSPGESVESQSLHLLEKLHNGEISISDLMGPLYGVADLTPSIIIPAGTKEYAHAAKESEFLPHNDSHNDELQMNVHPLDYTNPVYDEPYDLVVIGAGVSGLISVIIGAWLGKKCALIERHAMGGDCLNIGCVPSKALIACARAIHSTKGLGQFGVKLPPGEVTIDFNHVMKRMRAIRAKISHHDSVSRYSRDFCKHVYVGNGIFKGNNTIEVTGDDGTTRSLIYKKAMIATGASASIPPVPGLRDIPHLTNSNFFNLTELPPRMLVIGCGPIGLELSQCMARFGTKVFCFEYGSRLLPREDKDATDLLLHQLNEDGVTIITNVKIISVEIVSSTTAGVTGVAGGGGVGYRETTTASYNTPWILYRITIEVDGVSVTYDGEALLNATGRTPNVSDIGLENVNVEWDNRVGVHINDMFQTKNPDIYACGDCCTPYKFTHSADFQARLAIRNMFLGDNNKVSQLLIPWCTYTEPEIAHVGRYEYELDNAGIAYETFTRQLKDVDRCMCDGVSVGFIKITTRANTDEILGATICGPNAGDMISEITICMQYGIGVAQIAGTIHPYPTTQEAIRQACLGYNKYYKNPTAVPLTTLRMLMKEVEDASSISK